MGTDMTLPVAHIPNMAEKTMCARRVHTFASRLKLEKALMTLLALKYEHTASPEITRER